MAFIFNTTIPLNELPTPLILLPPHEVHNVLLSTYIHLGTFSILVWDVINNLRNDWRLVSSSKQGFPTSVYFTTRISLLAYAVGRALLLTHPIEDCAKFQDALNSFLIVFVASTALLFYIRVCALYAMKKAVVGFFGIFWLATVAMAGTYSKTFSAKNIRTTDYCLERPAGDLLGPALAVQLANELFLYLVVAYKVYALLVANLLSRSAVGCCSWNTTLFAITRFAVLEPHLYCLCIVATKAFLVCAAYAFHPPVNTMFIIVHLILTNVWSGRMYRAVQQTARPARELPMISQGEFEMRFGRSPPPPPSQHPGREQTRSPDFTSMQNSSAHVAPDEHIVDAIELKRTSTSIYSVRRDCKS